MITGFSLYNISREHLSSRDLYYLEVRQGEINSEII